MHFQTHFHLPRAFKALILTGGMAMALISLQACIGNPASEGDQKEQARVKDKAPVDTDRVCAAVVVCGADGKIYPTPCDAADAKVGFSYDMAACGVHSVPQMPRCGNEDDPIVTLPEDPVACIQMIVCDDDGKNCHSPCDKTR